MARYVVTVMEVYYKAIEIESCDAETAEALVRGQWDQGEIDLANGAGCFDHVEISSDELADVMPGDGHATGIDV